ncbi:MAG: NAD(P)H-hydrate epimerase [Candidatus Thorarchaeota archaeon]
MASLYGISMGLIGITKEQMIKVDEIMMNDLHVPVELMMEHAGHNLARLSAKFLQENQSIIVLAGSGNNGGGGLVSACRLSIWGYDVTVYLPQGRRSLRPVPAKQSLRVESLGIELVDGFPTENSHNLIIDAYLGYGYTKKENTTTEDVLRFLNESPSIISLDIPSGMDSNTGESSLPFFPKATMTIAFVKMGFLKADKEQFGSLFVADIGVPMSIFEKQLDIEWIEPYTISEVKTLYNAFTRDSLQQVLIDDDGVFKNNPVWIVT